MSTTKTDIPQWKLERYVLGELPAAELQAIEAALEESATLRKRVDGLNASDEAIRALLPALPSVAEEVDRLSLAKGRFSEFFNGFSLSGGNASVLRPVLGFALLLLVLTPVVLMQQGESETYGVRMKGGASLRIYKKVADSVQLLTDSAIAQAGDYLQMEYLPRGSQYGYIFSVDGRGTLTRHFPGEEATHAAQLTSENSAYLPNSYELDNAPAYERFFFVAANEPFPLAEIDRSAEMMTRKKGNSMRLDGRFVQVVRTLLKGK